jgi:ABC-type lipoprotein release transport system permease subunit
MAATSTLRIAWRNLGRNRKRSLLALTAIAVGQLAFLSVAALMNGYVEDFYGSLTGPMVGHVQVHAPGWREDRSIDVTLDGVAATLAEIRADPEVANASARVYVPVLAALAEEGFMSFVVGVDPAAESHASGLLPGESLSESMGRGRVLVGSGFAERHGIGPGTELALVGQDIDGSIASGLFAVGGIVSSPVDLVNSMGIVMSLEDAEELLAMSDQAHEIVVHVLDRDSLEETVARISSLPTLDAAEVLPWREVVPQLVAMIDMMDGFLLVILLIVFVAASAGIANTMLMSTFERKHEFGMLLSLGCGPGRLARMVTIEAVALGLLGVAVGTVLGLAFVLVTSRTGLDYATLGGGGSYEVAFRGLYMSSIVAPKLHVSNVAAGVVAVFLTSLVSVIWPIARIVRLDPLEVMRS